MSELRAARRNTEGDNLAALVQCAHAATKWQALQIPKQSTADLQEAYLVLNKEGHTVPDENIRIFTREISKALALEGKWKEWVGTLSLMCSEFNVSKPCFGATLPKRTAPEGILTEFWKQWRQSVLNDAVVGLLVAGKEGAQDLLEVAQIVVGAMAQETKELPEYASIEATSALRLFRGLVALLDPVPFALGSSLDDVSYVAPLTDDAKEVARQDFGLAGKSVMRTLAKDPFWAGAVAHYRSVAGAELSKGKAMLSLAAELQVLTEEIDKMNAEAEKDPSIDEARIRVGPGDLLQSRISDLHRWPSMHVVDSTSGGYITELRLASHTSVCGHCRRKASNWGDMRGDGQGWTTRDSGHVRTCPRMQCLTIWLTTCRRRNWI